MPNLLLDEADQYWLAKARQRRRRWLALLVVALVVAAYLLGFFGGH